MGIDVKFQAIPEDCELLQRARAERDVAELVQFLKLDLEEDFPPETEIEDYVRNAAKTLIQHYPDLLERHLFAGRKWDQIIYLLSEERRAGNFQSDTSIIFKAIYGSEHLHPLAETPTGFPIGFVPTSEVKLIADGLSAVSYEQLHEHYDPVAMRQLAVYTIDGDENDAAFEYTWNDFLAIRNLYQETALHNEAIIAMMY